MDYTVQCVNSILENCPQNITTEIIVFNHGSSDETKKFFESMSELKVINVAVNGVMPCVTFKAQSRGRYVLFVSNDVIIGKNAIGNLYRSAKEHRNYGYVVPTTPAVSNLQTISASYSTKEEFNAFVE